MSTRYRVYAYSASQHQKQQQMDLIDDVLLENASYAQQRAQSFAERLNREMFLRAIDWTPSIEAYEHVENPQPFELPGQPT
jgi:hypothetical protein